MAIICLALQHFDMRLKGFLESSLLQHQIKIQNKDTEDYAD